MSEKWRLLDWDYVCDQCGEIREAHEKASRHAEYGVNFYEFINTANGLQPMAQRWWDSLTEERQQELIKERISHFESLIEQLKA